MGNRQHRHQHQTAPQGPVAAVAAPASAPRCGDCVCFTAPPVRPEAADAIAWAAAGKDRGPCHRFPTVVGKSADDFCFEFIAKGLPHA